VARDNALNFSRFIWRRGRGDTRLLAGAFAGIFIAAVVVAAAPIYLRSLEKVGVADTLERMGPYTPNIQATTSWVPLGRADFETADRAVARVRDQNIRPLVRSEETLIKSTVFHWARTGQRMATDPLASEISFLHMSGHEAHVLYLDGVAPTDRVETGPDGVALIEVSLPKQRAAQISLQVGQVIDATPGASRHGMVRARITGLFEPLDWTELYWLGLGQSLLLPSPVREEQELGATFILQEGPVLDTVGKVTAGLPATYWWWSYVRPEVIREMPAGDIIATVDRFDDRLQKALVQPITITGLRHTFIDLQRRLLFARIPMFLLAALAVTIVAYYLFLVAGLLAKKREPDTVMLRSRGLSVPQVLRMYVIEACVLVGVPIAIAPVVGFILVSQFGRLPVYQPATGGAPLPVEITWKAWGWAAAAGAAAFVVLIIPALASARRGVSAQRSDDARPDRPPFFQRYYIDALLLVLGGLVWWELRSKGTVATVGSEGQTTFDLTLLFAPAMFIFAVALVFLRAFPLAAKAASWVASHTDAAWLAMGFWRLGRSPYWYAWPVLLVVLSAGLAVVAGTVASTMERSNEEQISYQTASDLHVDVGNTRSRLEPGVIASLRGIDGVQEVSKAMRRSAVHGTTSAGQRFTVLAVEALGFPKVGWYRPDFAKYPIPDLLTRLQVKVKPDPLYLPEGATEIGAWARTDPPVRDLFLWIVLRDQTGRTATVTLGPTAGVWQYQGGSMPPMQEPIEVVSIQTYEQAGPDGGHPTVLFIDDLQTIIGEGPSARVEVFADFEEPGIWTGLPTSEGLDTTYGLSGEPQAIPVGQKPGRSTGRVVMGRGTDNGIRGVYRTATAAPLPVLASPLFLGITNTRLGEPFVMAISGAYAPAVVVEIVDYFPTLDPLRDPFVIADVDSVIEFLELRGLSEFEANELFISTDPLQHEKVSGALQNSFRVANFEDRYDLLSDSLVDPLAVAGWRGIGVVAVIVAGVAATLGYITYLSAHHRRTQTDAAYMRSLGFSRASYMRMAMVEHLLVGLLGVGLGLASGLVVSGLAVSSFAHTVTGRELIPPFVLQTNWLPVALLLAAVTGAAAVSLGAILRAFASAPVYELVRMRE